MSQCWLCRVHTTKASIAILFCVKVYMENNNVRIFIMIRISQTFLSLKDYVHSHQIWSHFVGGHQLEFLPAGQETKTAILQAFGPR